MSEADETPTFSINDQTEARHTFVLKLTDRPGAMEIIAATFAHRGLSLTMTLGNDGTQDTNGHATVLVHFRATLARKNAVRASLSRLSRVVSLREHDENDTQVRQTALIRLAPETPLPHALGVFVQAIPNETDGDVLCVLLGVPRAVGDLINALRETGVLLAVTQTVLAL